MPNRNIYVTEPDLPPLEDLYPFLKEIWSSRQLTNNGPFHSALESKLKEFLGISEVSLMSNGTLALVTALQALRICGEVITTPYSFVATSHSLLWNSLTPVFVDIDPETGNIDPNLIERAITPETTAILAVHVYGFPCEVDKIKKIADAYNLKVIYDASHAFGVEDDKGSILNYGDLSTLSFHATKVFNTFEGGAIVSSSIEMKERIDKLKNFGFVNELLVSDVGINAKMNEFQAVVGLLQLNSFRKNIDNRRSICEIYKNSFSHIQGLKFFHPKALDFYNYSYMPIQVDDTCRVTRDRMYESLKEQGIFARKYFYPLITEFAMYRNFPSVIASDFPIAKKLSSSILCLPISGSMSAHEQERVVNAVLSICS